MNRPFFFITLIFIAGIWAAEVLKILFFIAAIMFFLCFAAFVLLKKHRDLVLPALFACLGIFLYSFHHNYFPKNHIKNFDGKIRAVEVVVSEIPKESPERIYFTADITGIYTKEGIAGNIKGKIRITIEKNLPIKISYGDVLEIKGFLRSPREPANSGEFNYKKYLRYRNILHTLYARAQAVEKKGRKIKNYFYFFSGALKEKLVKIIYDSVPPAEARVLEGIMLGNQRVIPDDVYDEFKITGTVHILAVSGMNVGLIGLFVFLILKIGGISRKISAVITLVFLSVFAVITGADASIVRATIMGYVVLAGIIIDRDADIYNSLAIAAFIILVFSPADLFDAGFQLSFLATFGLVYLTSRFQEHLVFLPPYVSLLVITTVTAQVFLIPVLANTFHQVSAISIIANLFIVPLSSAITILGFVMWIAGMISNAAAKIFGASIWALILFMKAVIHILSMIPYACFSVKTLPVLFTTAYYIFFLILPHRDTGLRLRIRLGRRIGPRKMAFSHHGAGINIRIGPRKTTESYHGVNLKYIIGVVLLVWGAAHLVVPQGKDEVTILSVRGINAVFAGTKADKKILILGCDDYKNDFAVRSKVVPFLRSRGINNIDYLCLYSVKNKKNRDNIRRNFRVKSIIEDKDEALSLMIDKKAKMYANSYSVEVDFGAKQFIFTKLITPEIARRNGAYIYPCFYSRAALGPAARNNSCLINSLNRRKPVTIESENIFDVGKGGMYLIKL